MLKDLLKGVPLQTDNLSEGFVLAKEFEKLEYNRYAPIISAFRMDKKTFELTINKADLFSQLIISLNEILKVFPNIEMPNPIKTYNDVKISSLLHDSEQSQEINEIKNQLSHHLYSDLITLEKVDYLIEVDKSRDNYVTYFLYDPIRYNTFEEVLNKSLLNLCIEWNDEEFNRLLERIDKLKSFPKSESAQRILQYLDEVRFRFNEWYTNNSVEKKTTGETKTKQKEETETIENKKTIKHGQLIQICAEAYQKLLTSGELDIRIQEKKSNKAISQKVVPILEIEYEITNKQKETIHTYFRKRTIEAKKTSNVIKVITNKSS